MRRWIAIVSHLFLFMSLTIAGRVLADVRLSEIMYNPLEDDSHREYIEVYNLSTATVNLTGWQIGDDGGFDTLFARLSAPSMLLRPNSYALILEESYFTDGGGVYDELIPEGTLILVVRDAAIGSGGLSNSTSETVRLVNAAGDTVSARTYKPGAESGQSEERINLTGGEGDDNWAFSVGGPTPGFLNSVSPVDNDLRLDGFDVEFGDSDEEGVRDVRVAVTVVNSGLATSGLDRSLSLDVMREGELWPEWSTSDWLTSLTPGEEYVVTFDHSLSAGLYRLTAVITPVDERPASDTLRDAFSIPAPNGSLVISEVMPSPPEAPDVEWFELFNSGGVLDLREWWLEDEAGNPVPFDSTTPTLEPNEILLVAEDSLMLEWVGLPTNVLLYVPAKWASLNNSGDSLTLFDPTGTVIDASRYQTSRAGVALQRLLDNEGVPVNRWVESPDDSGGTPGAPNPEVPTSGQAESVSVTVDPGVIKADGDGRDENLTFQLRFPSPSVTVTLRLYDRIGRQVGTLLEAETIPGIYDWEWDGHAGLNRSGLPVGIYIWHVSASAADGRSYEAKGTLVSAGY